MDAMDAMDAMDRMDGMAGMAGMTGMGRGRWRRATILPRCASVANW